MVHHRLFNSLKASTTLRTYFSNSATIASFSQPPISESHKGSLKWCSVTMGVMLRSFNPRSMARYFSSAPSSHVSGVGWMRLHSTEKRWAFCPASAARSKSSRQRPPHQSQARPDVPLVWPSCSHFHHWLLVLLPSTWWSAVAVPHRKPRGK